MSKSLRTIAGWVLFFTLGLLTPTLAGYRDLLKALDTYQPPSYVMEQAQAPSAPVGPLQEREFEAQKQRILDLKTRWEASVRHPPPEKSFFSPDPARLNILAQAAADEGSSASAIQPTLSLQDLEALVLLRNPGVKAAENRFRATLEQFQQVARLDDILRQYTAFTEGLMTGVGPMKGREPIKMRFPFPGIMALKGQVVQQEAKAQWEALEAARRDALTAARKACWQLWFVRRAQDITNRNVALLGDLEAVANRRYEAGKTSFQDVIKVRINRETLEEDLITFQEQQRNVATDIRKLLNLPDDVRVGRPKIRLAAQRVPKLAQLQALAQANRQEINQMRHQLGKMDRMIEMAETAILPSYSPNFSLFEDEAINQTGSQGGKPAFATSTSASTGAGLPKMPWFGASDAYLLEIRQKRAALAQELTMVETTTVALVRQKWFELDRTRRETRLYRDTVVKLSQAALDVSTSGYESGNVSFADVISSYTLWLNSNLALARKRSEFGIAWAELQQAIGKSL